MTSLERDITISGAGLAGSLLALLLAQRGFNVSVYEKRPDPTATEAVGGRSINLALSTRGIEALRLGGLAESALELAIPMAGRLVHDRSGESSLQPYGKSPAEVIYSISRAGLNELLIRSCRETGKIDLNFDTPCEAVDFDRKVIHVGHTEVPAPMLIACDGAGSVVRQDMEAAHLTDVDADILPHGYRELTIAARPDGSHALGKNALHIWPRRSFMLIALPNLDGTFTVTLFMPSEGPLSFSAFPDAASARLLFDEHFPDALPLMPTFETDYDQNPVGILGTIRCQPWSVNGYSILVGDAAHAIVPFFGQGMNCSFEDCIYLCQSIENEGSDWSAVASHFERIRKPDTDAIAEMALENYVEMRDHVADPRFILRKELSLELERRFPDRFIPRYSMVTFHRIPYAMAQNRGRKQADLLASLTEGIDSIDQIDWDRARRLASELPPLGPEDGIIRK